MRCKHFWNDPRRLDRALKDTTGRMVMRWKILQSKLAFCHCFLIFLHCMTHSPSPT
jgi:hypothetical protein